MTLLDMTLLDMTLLKLIWFDLSLLGFLYFYFYLNYYLYYFYLLLLLLSFYNQGLSHVYYLISSYFITFPFYISYYDWQPYQRWTAGLFHGRSKRMCWYLHLSFIELILTVLSCIFYLWYDCSYFFLLLSFFITFLYASSSFEGPHSTSFYFIFRFKFNLWYLNFVLNLLSFSSFTTFISYQGGVVTGVIVGAVAGAAVAVCGVLSCIYQVEYHTLTFSYSNELQFIVLSWFLLFYFCLFYYALNIF